MLEKTTQTEIQRCGREAIVVVIRTNYTKEKVLRLRYKGQGQDGRGVRRKSGVMPLLAPRERRELSPNSDRDRPPRLQWPGTDGPHELTEPRFTHGKFCHFERLAKCIYKWVDYVVKVPEPISRRLREPQVTSITAPEIGKRLFQESRKSF